MTGTWDVGPFDNDTAGDFGVSLDTAAPGERAGIVDRALARAVDAVGCLDAPGAEEAVAAAALVAGQCHGGEPVDPVHGPAEPLPDLTALRELAARALRRVMAEPSELMTLWSASAEDDNWRTQIRNLRGVLEPQPPEEQGALF
ncbi:DUF4259 domain-containing protein [Streptomyces lonarensis]|uniref:DUF4259 domain-containing protein n=1 Tax=Streptomyces lonarensis TaxID=700599 RepID=A0A7X6D1C4_9ACTN|nr:DUF4259 domain-containing protein [Streptomyces lonarensis]